MKVRVEFYGVLSAMVDARARHLIIDTERASVRDVIAAITAQHPVLVGRLDVVAYAVNDELVDAAHEVIDGDTLALLPPVSGG